MGQAGFLWVDPATGERSFRAAGPSLTIGRSAGAGLRIDHKSVSALHAQVRRQSDGTYVLEDLESTNGTYVGGRKVRRVLLRDGDEIELGDRSVTFTSDGSALARIDADLPGSGIGGPTIFRPGASIAIDALPVDERTFLPAGQVEDVETLRRDYEHLRLSHAVVQEIHADRPFADVLAAVAGRMLAAAGAARAVVLLTDASPDGLTLPAAAADRSGPVDAGTVPVPRVVLERVLAERVAVLCEDATAPGPVAGSPSLVLLGARSVMCVPLRWGDEVLGAVYLEGEAGDRRLDRRDLGFASHAAQQLVLAVRHERLVRRVREESRRRASLERFLSPDLVQEVLEGRLPLGSSGVRRDVAVLFTDLRKFTAFSESHDAESVFQFLNQYFEKMAEAVFRWEGTLDKFVGDALMAVFGAPRAHSDAAVRAVRCALDMQEAARELNAARAARGLAQVVMGAGVNFGSVHWGPIGPAARADYTVIGDVVNVASRLCSIAPGGEVLVGEPVRDALGDAFVVESLGTVMVKGRTTEIPVYRVVGPRHVPEN